MRRRHAIGLAALVALLGLSASAEAQEATLPGGASQLTERHGDWAVSCTTAQGGKDCALSQAARNPSTGSTLMAVELAVPQAGGAEGMMLTAFGLRLDAGIQLGVDGTGLNSPLPFLTCVATGCVVPLRFDTAALETLKAGAVLDVTGVKVEDGQPVTVQLSLTGFTAALTRTAELGAP